MAIPVAKLCLTLCDPMDCSTPGFLVLHHLRKFAQTHVHWVCDAIQPSHLCHPLLLLPSIFPSISIFSDELALHIMWTKYWSFSLSISSSNEYLGRFPLGLTGLIFFQSRDSQESSPASQFKSINSSALSLFYCSALTHAHDYWKNHSFDYMDLCRQSNASAF